MAGIARSLSLVWLSAVAGKLSVCPETGGHLSSRIEVHFVFGSPDQVFDLHCLVVTAHKFQVHNCVIPYTVRLPR